MAVNSQVTIKTATTGDVVGVQAVQTAANLVGSGADSILTLANGFNSIAVPTGGTTPKGVTIIPPPGNTNAITLKGITGDTGILLHKTDPTYISLDPGQATIGLTAGAQIVGVRFIWN